MRLAKGHARAEASEKTAVDGIEALKEAAGPWSVSWSIRDGLAVGRRMAQLLYPPIDILRDFALGSGRPLLSGGRSLSGHCKD